jgi:hypothetical protein
VSDKQYLDFECQLVQMRWYVYGSVSKSCASLYSKSDLHCCQNNLMISHFFTSNVIYQVANNDSSRLSLGLYSSRFHRVT